MNKNAWFRVDLGDRMFFAQRALDCRVLIREMSETPEGTELSGEYCVCGYVMLDEKKHVFQQKIEYDAVAYEGYIISERFESIDDATFAVLKHTYPDALITKDNLAKKGDLITNTCCGREHKAQFDFTPRHKATITKICGAHNHITVDGRCFPCLFKEELVPRLAKHGIVPAH